MSNNETMNESIRQWLYGCEVFPWLSYASVMHKYWDGYDTIVENMADRHASTAGKLIQKHATPDELRYIHENLSAETWDKLGLKLPEMSKAQPLILASPLAYTVPDLNAEERKHVEYLIRCVNSHCSIDHRNWTCKKCHNSAIEKIFGACPFSQANPRLPFGSPERAQVINALKDVLKQQKSLLPHNVIQFAKLERENWKWWLKQGNGHLLCPSTRRSNIATADCKNQCCPVFPDVEPVVPHADNCPCHRESPEITRTIIEQCIARGPKFEEYNIYCQGQKHRVISEDDTNIHLSDGSIIWKPIPQNYTKTPPPPKEEFQPYVAWDKSSQQLVKIVEINSDAATSKVFFPSDETYQWIKWSSGHLTSCSNPLECRNMLNEVLGEESMVEEIKVHCEELREHFKGQSGEFCRGKAIAYRLICDKINSLKRKAENKA